MLRVLKPSRPTWRGLERGQINATVDLLERLAKRLGVKPVELFVEPKPGEKPPSPLEAGRRPRQ